MSDLKTQLWVQALLKRVVLQGGYAVIARRGDPDAGAVLVVIDNLLGEARLYAPERIGDAERAFRCIASDRHAIDAMIARRAVIDPDLWVVEIEDRALRHFLTETILE